MLSEFDIQELMSADDAPERANGVVQTNLTQGSYGDPDGYAQDKRLADEAGIDISVVRHDKEEIKRQVGLSKIDIQTLVGESPALNEWLKDQDNANIAYDDIPQLVQMEKVNRKRSWMDVSFGDFKGLGDSMALGLEKMYHGMALGFLSDNQMQQSHYDVTQKILRDKGMDAEADKNKKAWEKLQDKNEKMIKHHFGEVEKIADEIDKLNPGNLTTMGKGIRGGIQMGADVLPGLIISGITRGRVNPTLPYLVTKTGTESYTEARIEGLEHDVAVRYGTIDAFLELLTEKIPTKLAEDMFSKLGTKDLKSTIAKFMFAEMGGEQIATATQTLNAVAHGLDKDLLEAESIQEIFDIQVERQIVTAISVLVGSGGISGTAYTANRLAGAGRVKDRALLKNIEKKLQSDFADKWLEDQIFLAQSSKTNERSAESFAEYLEQLDPETRVFMDAEIASQLKEIPDYIQEQLDGTGADVSIPLAKFLSDFATNEEMLELVRPHVKVQADFLTQTELQGDGDSAQVKTLLEKANKETEAKTEADMIFEQVKDQLMGTGRQGEATSRLSAQLIPAYIVTKQKELASRGIDRSVKQLYEDMGLSIVGPKGDPATTKETQILEQANESGLVVAARMEDGSTVKGKKGQIHAMMNIEIKDDSTELGFMDDDGNFYTREEALDYIRIDNPDFDSTYDDELVSEDFDIDPTVSATQKFGDLTITDTGLDEAGNTVKVKERVQSLWNHHQKRIKMVDNLRACLHA